MENKVIIDFNSEKRNINPYIYGNILEHISSSIHNGMWTYDPVNVPLVKNNPFLIGVREDILHVVKELKPSVIRFSGGCFSDHYHWRNAIGPRDSRVKVKNTMWGSFPFKLIKGLGPDIDNQWGTEELGEFCSQINAEMYLNVNYGSGSPEEAADWVEYCNGSADTKWGRKRIENGRIEPYNVKFWGIGNEIYLPTEKGYERFPENYAKRYLLYAKKMREKDPSIKLVACGHNKKNWNKILLKEIGEEWIDLLSIHLYVPSPFNPLNPKTINPYRRKHPDNLKSYEAVLASPIMYEELINETWNELTSVLGDNTSVRITLDEWGLWYIAFDLVKTNYNLQDGLWTALLLQRLQKYSDKNPLCLWSELLNCVGMIQSDKDGVILTPIYWAMKMFVEHTYNLFIEDVKVKCDIFNTKRYFDIPKIQKIPFIDCSATSNLEEDKLSIVLVNKHFTDKLRIVIDMRGYKPNNNGSIIELFSDSPFDYNTIENRNKIKPIEKQIDNIQANMTVELPPHSITILKLNKK